MDHAEALEHIELAAVEPEGLVRLMAGDTPESSAVAGHLAGCVACVAELARIRRTSALVRQVVGSMPDPALRGRTLAYVREFGRDRSGMPAQAGAREAAGADAAAAAASMAGPATSAPESAPAPATPVPQAAPVAAPVSAPLAAPVPLRPRAARPWLRYAGLAAALVVALGLGFVAGGMRATPGTATREIAVLQSTTRSLLAVDAQPDSVRVELVATAAGGPATGSLLFSPSTGELVMVADGLAEPPEGMEYGCWIEVDGTKRRIGRMYTGGDLQSWAGPVDGLADLPKDAVFGVSLVPKGGGSGEPLLTGSANG